jgi:hypothetical protein
MLTAERGLSAVIVDHNLDLAHGMLAAGVPHALRSLPARALDRPGRVLIGKRPERGRTRTAFRYQTQAVRNLTALNHINRVSQRAFDKRLLCLRLTL